jgi:peptidoglycan hydrolase-like protein with peptidoglycan-binding domain
MVAFATFPVPGLARPGPEGPGEVVTAVSGILKDRGFYKPFAESSPGEVDAALSLAVRAWQAAAGDEIDGVPDAHLLAELMKSDLRALAISSPMVRDPQAIKDIQSKLADQGLIPAESVDGSAGPATEEAIRAYQRDEGLPVDGVPSKDLFSVMVAQ